MANPIDHNAPALNLFFDESGFTGPRLLDEAQRHFAYASVAYSDEDSWRLLQESRATYPVQMPELKAQKLLKTDRGVALVEHVLDAIEGRYSFVVQNKLLVLCGKFFEYIYEPVVQQSPELLYEKGLHKFVAMYAFIFFQGELGGRAVNEFQAYMKTLDPEDAPLLFDPTTRSIVDPDDPFGIVLDFAQGYREQIIADNTRMRRESIDEGKWVLDVSVSGLWSLLNYWGQKGRPLSVTCDDSKPIRAIIDQFPGGDEDPGLQRLRAMGRDETGFGFHLARRVALIDSRGSPGLQLADLVAGSATAAVDPSKSGLEGIRERLSRHVHRDSIAPDFDVLALGTKETDVNWIVLMELGKRAQTGADPMIGLADFYSAAEKSWRPERLA